jgi:signal transduction histidine kinase
MKYLPSHYRIQKGIGYILLGGGIGFGILNFCRMIELGEDFDFSNEHTIATAFVLFLAVFIFITSRVDRVFMRFLQVIIFTIAGLIAMWLTKPFEMTSMVILVYSFLLAIQYSFLEKKFLPKLTAYIGFIFIWGIVAAFIQKKIDIIGTLAGISFIVFFILLLWITYYEVLKDYLQQLQEVEQESKKNSVFIKFGKNIAGLVHNLKNMLTIIQGMNSLIRRSGLSDPVKGFVNRQQLALDKMSGTITRILNVVKAKQDTSLTVVDINEIIAGIIDFFQTNTDFKRDVKCVLDLHPAMLYVELQPLQLCEIVENLVKNSWESFGDRIAGKENIITVRTFANNRIGFTVSDNGPGIHGLTECSNEQCAVHFPIGSTTKSFGSGVGMPFVMETVKANQWLLAIKSSKKGTEVTIRFGET